MQELDPNTEMNRKVILPFLEKRNYLHGTTLFRYLRAYAPPRAETCFRITSQIRTNTILVTHLQKVIEPVARLDWIEDGNAYTLAVAQLPMQSPISREPYDETQITAACDVNGHHVYLKGRPPYDVVDTAVPMFKFILRLNGYSSDSGGQWMFTRLDSIASHATVEKMALRLALVRKREVAKAEIIIGGTHIADMYFSWVP
jgi:hypothetical protein